MDSLNAINSKLTIQSAAAQIEKILKISQISKAACRTVSDGEIELIKGLCKSDNLRICQLANEVLLHLAKEGFVELGQALGLLMTLLPNTSPRQFITIGESIFNLLLLDLRRRCISGGNEQNYVCQFDLKSPQHPVILLIDKSKDEGWCSLLELIRNTLTHRDDIIRENSVEFLRPVLLYLFVNMHSFSDCQLWKLLVERSLHDPKTEAVLFEILAWRKSTTANETYYTASLLMDALEIIQHRQANITLQFEIVFYLAAVLKDYTEYNYDPSRCFALLAKTCDEGMKSEFNINFDTLLAVVVDVLPVLSPVKMCGALGIIQRIIPVCGKTSRIMVKEAMIQLLGQPSFVTKYLPLCDAILKTIDDDLSGRAVKSDSHEIQLKTVYYHSELAKWTILSRWWLSSNTAIEEYFRRNETSSIRFAVTLSQLHRSIFVSSHYDEDVWLANFNCLGSLMQQSELQIALCIFPLLYALAQLKDPRRRLRVLQAIASMGAKENLIGILKVLTKDLDRALCLDLYLRLWKAEPRTYPLLYNLLKDTSRPPEDERWEHTLARAYTIREVCLIKPQQHGEDLVNLFSEVLSNPNDGDNEVAICLSLDAISSLCENNVVNIVSTWKVLGFRFANEHRPRIIKSLCRFFSNVPLIKITTPEQEQLVNHIIQTLWRYVTDYNEREIIEAALATLKHFNPDSLSLRQIPEVFRRGIDLPEPNEDGASTADDPGSVPPECWIQLLQYTNHCAIEAVGELLCHYVTREVEGLRGGIYQTPEGRPEPSNLRYLPRASILSTIVNHLISQSTKFTNNMDTDELVLIQMLHIVAKPYPKPIPPLNWCFLHEYFHHCAEMRDACLQIAVKQMPYSGTAKRLVENYLNELSESEMVEEDLLKIYTMLARITEAVQTDIYKRFLHLSLHYLAERAEDHQFADHSPFIQAMELISDALQREQKYENEDNFHHLCMTVESFFLRFQQESEVFDKYIHTMVHLPEQHFVTLLKPSSWTEEVSVTKLRKVIKLQFAFRRFKPNATSLHFSGLADIVTSIAKHPSRDGTLGVYFLCEFYDFVQLFIQNDDRQADGKMLIAFIGQLVGLIQANLAATRDNVGQETLFMVDTLATAVISYSGYGGLYGTQMIAEDTFLRLALFPLALFTVFQQHIWREIETKIYEFLHHLYGITSLPNEYAECLRNSLICCKKQPYFQLQKTWPKFVSMRRF